MTCERDFIDLSEPSDEALEYIAELADRAAAELEPMDVIGYGSEFGAGEAPEPVATLVEALNAQWGYNGWGWWPLFSEWFDQAIEQAHDYGALREL